MSASSKLVAVDPAGSGYRLREQIGFALRRAQQRHIAIFVSNMADLTPPQFAALAQLYEAGEMSQNQLGSQIAMDAATIKGVIGRIAARGFVKLTKHPADKRRLTVCLTDEGRQLVEQLFPVAEEITAKTLEPLDAREAASLVRLLTKIA